MPGSSLCLRKLLAAFLLFSPFLALISQAQAQVQESSAESSIAECQQALLARKVANGEFADDVLTKAITSPAEKRESGENALVVEKLFRQLGAEKFEEREAATRELVEKHVAPGNLRSLLRQTRDPEVAIRAKKILLAWKEKVPAGDYDMKFRMWMNCPSCIAKLKTYQDVSAEASKHNRHQAIYDACRGLRLDDFPQDQRTDAVVYWLDEMKRHSMPLLLFRQLRREEWNEGKLKDAVCRIMQGEAPAFYGNDFEELISNLPEDIDLKELKPSLASAGKQKGAIAAMLVKTGDREALPAFLELLNQEWTSINIEKGKFRGGSHDIFYSPFPNFEILKQRPYRKFAPEILKGIEAKFADDRIGVHDCYLNVVEYFSDTKEGAEFLRKLCRHSCPQTALRACLILSSGTLEDDVLADLLASLKAASSQDIINNHEEFTELLRKLRGRMLLDAGKADYYRKYIVEAASVSIESIYKAAPDYLNKDAIEFYVDELLPFGLVAPDRQKIIGMLSSYTCFDWWTYPEAAVRFLVQDALAKGDLPLLSDQLEAAASAPGAKLGAVALFADFAMITGQIQRLGKMKGKLKTLLAIKGEGEDALKACPAQIVKAVWMLNPEMVIESPQDFEWGPNFLLLKGNNYDYKQIAGKLNSQPHPWKGAFFRLSYDLEGADLPSLNETGEYEFFHLLSEMAWKKPPTSEAMGEKLGELCRKLETSEYFWQVREFLKSAPELVRKFKIKTGDCARSPMMMLLEAEMAFRRGDVAAFRNSVSQALKDPGLRISGDLLAEIERKEIVLELASGVISDRARSRVARAGRNGTEFEAHRLVSILYENGYTEKARELRSIVQQEDIYSRWDRSESYLSWAWNEAIAGNRDEAVKLVEAAICNGRSRQICEYALKMHGWLKNDSGEFEGLLNAMALKRDFSRRAEYAVALAKFAEKSVDKDMRSLAAFLSGRLSRSLGMDEGEVRKILEVGAEARGFHSGYCREMLSSIPEKDGKFVVSTSWYSRDDFKESMTPFTNSFGICYGAGKTCHCVSSCEWIGPYGITSSLEDKQYFCDGSGWWIYVMEQAKAWVPGEWSVFIRYEGKVEYHQRKLLPFISK